MEKKNLKWMRIAMIENQNIVFEKEISRSKIRFLTMITVSCIVHVHSNSELSSLTIYALFAIIFFCYSWQTFRPKDLIIVNTTRKFMWTNRNKINKDQYSLNFFRINIFFQNKISREKCKSCLAQVINIFNCFNTDQQANRWYLIENGIFRAYNLQPTYYSYASLWIFRCSYRERERVRQISEVS